MPYTPIDKSSLHVNTHLFSGNGATNAITGVGFQPDWVWSKSRNQSGHHLLYDSVRGVQKFIQSSTSNTESTNANTLTSFDSDGFTFGSADNGNANSSNGVTWNWKAGTTSGLSGGDITPTAYSINTVSGFGIYQYNGNGSDNQTIVHGLGVTPDAVLFKSLTNSESWRYHYEDRGQFFTHRQILDDNVANTGQTDGLKAASSTTVTIGNGGAYNTNGQTYIMYLFCNKLGYSRFSHYTGNGSTDGSFIYTGFKPALVITKNQNATDSWILLDNKRDTGPNPHKLALFPNGNDVEAGDYLTDFLSNGFKIRSATGSLNTSGSVYLYLAFAEAPFVASNDTPVTGK